MNTFLRKSLKRVFIREDCARLAERVLRGTDTRRRHYKKALNDWNFDKID